MQSKKLAAFAKLMKLAPWQSKPQAKALRANIALFLKARASLEKLPPRAKKISPLAGQAFDAFFLAQSSLYRKSRELFLEADGEFQARLSSSPRSLSSAILLENRIQYSPTEDELFWMATDDAEKKNDEGLLRIVSYSTSVFHEQTHRILWQILPLPRTRKPEDLRRYLNFIEAVVVGIDMALGDELGPELSSFGYLSGTIYDPGSYAQFESARERRNYLHIAIRTTYLALEPFDATKVDRALSQWLPEWMPSLPREAGVHAVKRALRLDDAFIEVTNLAWQKKHLETFKKFLGEKARAKRGMNSAVFTLSPDAQSWIDPYLVVEKVFDHLGL
ncbi:MAG: hypothetical protein H7301_08715 [Cryobacterium sp.]|nr:hypothetical protein [Oligoflexia bacterium]